ncbi:Putative peptidase inhibitor (plasmid) [Streptomyces clavuligerus]|uniref:Putative peptidase inhibitor n=2 Tax=Streptomyces clavuligerus TaxID=1901 RepID=D5SLS3_STRCL|nr:Putative peptidase inhibitor [Streptomyces clavuligerus]
MDTFREPQRWAPGRRLERTSFMRTSLTTLVMASVTGLAAIGLAAPSAVAAAPAPMAPNCDTGYFCLFSGANYTGERCIWATASIPDTIGCSFIRAQRNVLSVANSTGHRKQYYTGRSYEGRIGSTPAGGHGNLAGTYQIRSFRPQ